MLRRPFLLTAGVLLLVALLGVSGWQLRASRAALTALTPSAVDIGFAQHMGQHHQQAITMSQLMLDGRPTPLAGLARSIAGQQLLELGEMQGWLRLWDRPLLPVSRSMDWMRIADAPPNPELDRYLLACRNAATGMPGLASDAELNELRQLDGRARDLRFIELMLAHHEGGLPMARLAAQAAHLPAVRDLATRLALDQVQEISFMQRLQTQLLAAAP